MTVGHDLVFKISKKEFSNFEASSGSWNATVEIGQNLELIQKPFQDLQNYGLCSYWTSVKAYFGTSGRTLQAGHSLGRYFFRGLRHSGNVCCSNSMATVRLQLVIVASRMPLMLNVWSSSVKEGLTLPLRFPFQQKARLFL